MWNWRRKVAWLVLLPLAILAALILSLPLFLNTADYRALLIAQAEAQLGRKVEMGRSRVEVFPYVRLALEDVVIRERNSPEVFLSAQHLFIDLRIFPLLKRKVLAKRIVLDMPRVTIKRAYDGRLNISDLFAAAAGESGFATPMLGEEMSIADGEIGFEDDYATVIPRKIAFRRVNTTVKRTGLQLEFKFFAAWPQETGDATLTVTGQVSRRALEQAGRQGKTTGRVEAKGVSPARLAPFFNDNVLLLRFREPADLTASFEYRWSHEDRALDIKGLNLVAAGTTISGTVALAKLFSPQMQLVSTLATTPFRLESVLAGLPEETIQAYALGFLKRGQVAGSVQLVSGQVEWMPDRERRLTVQGEVDLSGGSAVVGEHHVPLSEVKGRLRIAPDRIAIEQLTGRYGLAEVTAGRGEVTSLLENPHLFLDITGKVSAPELAVIVARFAPKALLPAGPAGLSGLHGEADAVVTLDGPLANFDDLEVEWGITVKDLGFTDKRLALPFSGLHGGVRSVRRGVAFERLSGRVGGSALVLDGEIAVQSDEKAHYALKVSGQADAKEMAGLVLGGPSPALSTAGTAGFGVTISGRTRELRGIGRVDLRRTGLAHPSGFRKPEGVPSAVEFDVLWDPGRRLRLNRLVAEIPPLRAQAKGLLALQAPRRFDLDVQVPTFAIRALPRGVQLAKTSPSAGTLQTRFEASGPLDNWRAAKLKGQAEVKRVRLAVEGLSAPIEELNATVSFEEDRIEIASGTFKIADSRINATGDIRGWRGVPRVQAVFDSPGLDLELLIPEGERSPMRSAMETISGSAKVAASAAIRNARYRGIRFEEIRATVAGGDGVLVVDPVTGRIGKGTAAGQARIALPSGKPASVETTLHLKGVAVEPLLQALGINEPPFSGSVSLDGAVRGDGTHPQGTSRTLNGDVRVMIEKGHFRKLSATSKIIGILNLPTLLAGKVDFSDQGMPFDCMSGRVVVKDGIAEIQDYRVDSPIMKITAAGTYDIPNDRYDMIMVVSPFGSYSELLQSIPLFGKLFAGEREGFTTAFFEVKGPLTDPTVHALPMKSLASGVTGWAQLAFDVMKNVITLPKELIAPSDKAKSPCSAQ